MEGIAVATLESLLGHQSLSLLSGSLGGGQEGVLASGVTGAGQEHCGSPVMLSQGILRGKTGKRCK